MLAFYSLPNGMNGGGVANAEVKVGIQSSLKTGLASKVVALNTANGILSSSNGHGGQNEGNLA